MGLMSWVSTNGVLDAGCSRLILDRAASCRVAGVSNPHCLGPPWCSVAWSTMPGAKRRFRSLPTCFVGLERSRAFKKQLANCKPFEHFC